MCEGGWRGGGAGAVAQALWARLKERGSGDDNTFGGSGADFWDASRATRGDDDDAEGRRGKKRKEDEERNRLAQLMDKKKREASSSGVGNFAKKTKVKNEISTLTPR